MAAILIWADAPKSIASVLKMIWHYKWNLKSIGEMVLKILRSQGMSIAYILKSSMAAIVFSRWPKMYSVCPLNNMKTNFKFEVIWGSGSKDIAFTSINYLLLHIFQKADGGHLDFSRWPKIKFSFSKTLNRPPTYRLICMYNLKWFNAAVSEKKYKVCI